MKKTAKAPSNIAFIKYWGQTDSNLRIPTNGSISMNLSNLYTTTTVEFLEKYEKDEVSVNAVESGAKIDRVITHLDRVRKLAHIKTHAKVVSKNNFPTGTGLSSSASGFAALTVASVSAAGLQLSEKELSILARQASGSACRSIPSGFVEWEKGDTHETSYAHTIFPADHWDVVDIVVAINSAEKHVPTTQAQYCALTSPFFKTRLMHIDKKIEICKRLIADKNFTGFGELVESEALELHSIMMTSIPSLLYLYPKTLELMQLVQEWRRNDGLQVYFTLNTGHNIHLICEKKSTDELIEKLKIGNFQNYYISSAAVGTQESKDHLF